ncbi:MAG: phytanoyl-CoA dioxygenase family protein [Nitratireductor sp.]|nr:phytanoyl-CoA dioxygenase family protein [Nitratireductor sp.]
MSAQSANGGYFSEELCDIEEFKALTSRTTNPGMAPSASVIEKNVPLYDAPDIEGLLGTPQSRRALMAEWAAVLMNGPGVLVIRQAYRDTACLDAATEIFERIIASEKKAGGGADHFAKAGANDRIWNSLQKLCMADPGVFALYHGNPSIDAVCEAWLGPNYQMTAQVNLVRPGGAAQQAHRDYHIGFQTAEISASYPAHVHLLSPVMTLQGGIAHVDIPVEAGPTKLLPFSQAYAPGYAAWRREDFRAHFEENYIQLPLKKGDAIFFNPALFHAGGENRTSDVQRLVNLLQVSSAFGRAMETVNRKEMCKSLYPAIRDIAGSSQLTEQGIHAAISACAEGYSFPTNLDLDPPVGGLAPRTQNQLFHQALSENWTDEQFFHELDALEERQRA